MPHLRIIYFSNLYFSVANPVTNLYTLQWALDPGAVEPLKFSLLFGGHWPMNDTQPHVLKLSSMTLCAGDSFS